jgi:Methyltransferase domain
MLNRAIRDTVKDLAFRIHKLALRAGVLILPNHYYVNYADVNQLAASMDVWARRSSMRGIETSLEDQIRCLHQMCDRFSQEVAGNAHYLRAVSAGCGTGFGYIEAQVLHCVIRTLSPRHIVEVGPGVSTYCALEAVKLNANVCEVTCIEPYPRQWLRQGPVKLIDQPVQSVSAEFFDLLQRGDLLFIDSSHTVKIGSDVNFLILEVLPRLKAGVVVHLHDIFLPFDYPADLFNGFDHWQETALLHAYLIGNRNVRILFGLAQLHHDYPDQLRKIFPEYQPEPLPRGLRLAKRVGHFPSSIYLETLEDGSGNS